MALERLLVQRLSPDKTSKLIVHSGRGPHLSRRLKGRPDILGQHRQPSQRLELPCCVHGLEVLGSLDTGSVGEYFFGLGNRYLPAISLPGLDGLLVQLLDPSFVVASELLQSRCCGLRSLRRRGLGARGPARKNETDPISSPNPRRARRAFMAGLILWQSIGV